MKIKGISPLIATVLLIGIVMAVSVMLAIWAMSFVQTRLPTEKPTECENMDVRIDRCSLIGNKIYITIHNYRNVEAKNLTAQLLNSTSSGRVFNLEGGNVKPGEFKTFSIDKDVENFDRVVVSSSICTSMRVSTSC